MTNEEATRILRVVQSEARRIRPFDFDMLESFDIGIKALEKQIPKKPDYIYNGFEKSNKRWRCPNCSSLIYEIDSENCEWGKEEDYCSMCGQAILWEDE